MQTNFIFFSIKTQKAYKIIVFEKKCANVRFHEINQIWIQKKVSDFKNKQDTKVEEKLKVITDKKEVRILSIDGSGIKWNYSCCSLMRNICL